MRFYSRKNYIAISLLLLIAAINIFFFVNRNKFGTYKNYVSYDNLYSEKNNQPELRKRWNNTFRFNSNKEKDSARKLAISKAGIILKDSSFQKMIKIAKWISNEFRGISKGQPIDSVLRLPMLEQYEATVKNQTPIWCGTYANMFLFFCKASNIETRIIEFFKPGDHHVINECYLPELKKWIAVDLTYNYIFFQNESYKLLNTLDIKTAVENNRLLFVNQAVSDTLIVKKVDGKSIAWEQYLRFNPDIYYYKETNPAHIYTIKDKIKRYIFPVSHYSIFTTAKQSNIWFFIRTFFIYTLFLLIVYLLYRLFKVK
jgi:hypothetical protein